MPARFVEQVSGHSTRVGAAQNLAELDIDLAAITQAGGWKSTRSRCNMPRRSTRRGPEWLERRRRAVARKRFLSTDGRLRQANVSLSVPLRFFVSSLYSSRPEQASTQLRRLGIRNRPQFSLL